MESVKTTFQIVQDSLSNFFTTTAEFLPSLFGALIILIIGWIIAKMIKWAVLRVLKAIKFNNLTGKLGINDYLSKGGINTTGAGLIASLVYWIIMLSVLNTFFNSLGLEVVSTLLNSVILYIPNIIVGCILLVVGMYLAEFVSGFVVATLKAGSFDNSNAETLGKVAHTVVMFFVAAMVLSQLGIGKEIVQSVVQIVLGGLGLAVAIAFGFGGRDWAGHIVNKYFPK